MAAFRAESPAETTWSEYPDGYGQEVFGITPAGEIKQVTTDQRSAMFGFSPDGSELYVLKNPAPISDNGDPFRAQNRTLDLISADTAQVVSTAPAPDAQDVAVAAATGDIAIGGEFDASVRVHSATAASQKVDGTTETLSINASADVAKLYPEWSPDGAQLAYIAAPVDQVSPAPQVRVRSIATGEEKVVYEMGEPGGILSLSWSPDGTRILAMETQDDRVDETPRWVGVEIDIAGQIALTSTPMAYQAVYSSTDQVIGVDENVLSLYQRSDSGFQLVASAELDQYVSDLRVPQCATTA